MFVMCKVLGLLFPCGDFSFLLDVEVKPNAQSSLVS